MGHQVYHHDQEQDMVEEHHEQGTVALDDYADESYGYDQYGEGYDDGSGMMDSSGMAMGPADGNKDLLAAIKSRMQKLPNGMWSCTECGYETNYYTALTNHIESKHIETDGFVCEFCQTFCPTRNALKSHKH